MSKLDEIEAVWSTMYGRGEHSEWLALNVPLLIRAVRQFSAAYLALALENALGKSDVDYKIDQDVADLIAVEDLT